MRQPRPADWKQRRALLRAFAWGLQAEVRPVSVAIALAPIYRVPSRTEPGLLYSVAVTHRDGAEHLTCSCPAGVMGQPCTHAAAVWLYRMEQRSGGQILSVRPGA